MHVCAAESGEVLGGGVRPERIPYELSGRSDAAHADRLYRDGTGVACVRAMPVWAVLWGTRSPAFGLEDAVAMLATSWVGRADVSADHSLTGLLAGRPTVRTPIC